MQHLVIDCATGIEQPLTHGEAIAHSGVAVDENFEQQQAELATAQEAQRQQRDADLAAIKGKAKTDPAFAALARHLGII
jgi:hypothetical protein